MKKVLLMATMAVIANVQITEAAFTGPSGDVNTTVEQVKKMPDDTNVVLRGYIEKALGDEKYVFKDDTGSIVVEIDDDDWGGLDVSPKDKVEIRGEVDTHMMKPTDIDVDTVQLVK
ncbi:MAG: NirD/YgiW/YdeI family stress tolerance protein [Alphaproteobacteria bacterium]|nr:NirD/YgiW/YdeI family stress tolerance protein [Alphaproteobacteria bacterium]MBQ7284812.1 NirD/YgiW/YdeI family stress tolerance protein [Alphaproteobacteria bacterium]